MTESSQSRIPGFLRLSGLAQFAAIIIVGLMLLYAMANNERQLRWISAWVVNGIFDTPEPQTSIAMYFVCALVLLWMAIVKAVLLPRILRDSGGSSGSAGGIVLVVLIICTLVALFSGLHVLIWSAVAADFLGGGYILGLILCAAAIVLLIADVILLIVYLVRRSRAATP